MSKLRNLLQRDARVKDHSTIRLVLAKLRGSWLKIKSDDAIMLDLGDVTKDMMELIHSQELHLEERVDQVFGLEPPRGCTHVLVVVPHLLCARLCLVCCLSTVSNGTGTTSVVF